MKFNNQFIYRKIALITRTLFPAVVNTLYNFLRNRKIIINNVNREVLSAILAFLANSISRSLASVQKGISYPLNVISRQPIGDIENNEEILEKCVKCTILHEPDGELVADIIFIHGLHGSIQNTWKQGLWRHKKHKLRNVRGKRKLKNHKNDSESNDRKRIKSETYFLPNNVQKVGKGEILNETSKEDNQNCNDGYSACWPKDWIPKDCPGVRIIAIDYTTDPYLWRPVWIKKQNR